MLDPRKDLKRDTMFWELVLTCATAYNDKQVYGNLHGFRCYGAQLELKNNNLLFQLPKDLDEETKQDIKHKYVSPYVKQFKELFKFVAEYYQEYKDDFLSYRKNDFFDRDVLTKGYQF